MSRLVVPEEFGKGHFASDKVEDHPPDEYTERLLKYIPAESVSLFAFVDKALTAYYGLDSGGGSTARPPDGVLTVLPAFLILLGLVGTPIYLYNQRKDNQPWKLHAVLATIAFGLWAYTLGGSFFILNQWYHPLLAAIAAPVFTFVAGMFRPNPSKPGPVGVR
jgi:hypothetical protein